MQIGMPCTPEALCDIVEWVFLGFGVFIVGCLLWAIFREWKKQIKKNK